MDRNNDDFSVDTGELVSLSARRAWIEIYGLTNFNVAKWSLSARRAWIEIYGLTNFNVAKWSLSARRAWIEILMVVLLCHHISSRSPQGERG